MEEKFGIESRFLKGTHESLGRAPTTWKRVPKKELADFNDPRWKYAEAEWKDFLVFDARGGAEEACALLWTGVDRKWVEFRVVRLPPSS